MKRPADIPVLPVEETVKHKTDNLDWQGLSSQPCELEFRPPMTIPLAAHLRVCAILLLASVVAPPAALVLQLAVARYLWNWQAAAVAIIIAILVVGVYHLRQIAKPNRDGHTLFDSRAALLLVVPLFAWFAVAMAGFLDQPAGAFLYLVCVALPAAVLAADRMATHALYWVTAGIQIDNTTVRSWREDWAHRFLKSPSFSLPEPSTNETTCERNLRAVAEARRNYWLGLLWLLGAVVFPTFLVLVISRKPNPNTIGLQLAIAVCLGLAGAALLRTGGEPQVFKRYWTFLVHWLHYASDGPTPPWVFQSPGGSVRQRRMVAAAAIAILSVALGYLSIRPLIFVVASTPSATAVNAGAENAIGTGASTATLTPQYSWVTPTRVALVIVLLALGTFVPAIVFCLATLVFAGPAISAYYDALEA